MPSIPGASLLHFHGKPVLRLVAVLMLLVVTVPASRADGHLVDFLLPDADGRMHRLSDHRGKWVVINFWATWCGPCMVEIPELMRFHERRKDRDAIVIGVNFEEIDTPDLVKFIADMGINYLVVRAGDKPILPFEPLKGLPSTFFVDPHGELVASHVGPVTGAAIEDFLDREAQRSGGESSSSGIRLRQARRVAETPSAAQSRGRPVRRDTSKVS